MTNPDIETPAAIWRAEISATFTLAVPIALTQLGQVAMMTTDLALIGRIGDKLPRALIINVEQNILTNSQRTLDLAPGRTIIVSVDKGGLKQFSARLEIEILGL